MAAPGYRAGDCKQGAVESGGYLDAEAVAVAFAGVVLLPGACEPAGRDVGAVDQDNSPAGEVSQLARGREGK
jgi:hypothetical protein